MKTPAVKEWIEGAVEDRSHLHVSSVDLRKILAVYEAGQALYDLLTEHMPDTYVSTDSRMKAWRKALNAKL
jgi:hypothetical protein